MTRHRLYNLYSDKNLVPVLHVTSETMLRDRIAYCHVLLLPHRSVWDCRYFVYLLCPNVDGVRRYSTWKLRWWDWLARSPGSKHMVGFTSRTSLWNYGKSYVSRHTKHPYGYWYTYKHYSNVPRIVHMYGADNVLNKSRKIKRSQVRLTNVTHVNRSWDRVF
jgi:hypothetical protein